jgi:transposase
MPRSNNPRKTWQYSTDFKVKAVELGCQEGIQVQQAARVGVQVSHFPSWF